MNIATILRLLKNSGFHVLGTDGTVLYLEDPSCILRSFQTFLDYAWIIITALTGILLFGWAISMIRGAKNDIFTNMRNLILIFGTLAMTRPIINLIYGSDLFVRGCRTITVNISDVQELLDMRTAKMSNRGGDLYEEMTIYDSGSLGCDKCQERATDTPDDNASSVLPTEVPPDTGKSLAVPISEPAPSNVAPSVPPVTSAPAQNASPVSTHTAYTNATASGRDVIYTTHDGARTRRSGGSRAWRNMNPGNIRYSEFSRRVGAIGQAGGFAVFPDEETGMRAIGALLRGDSYNNLTIAAAISRYAPPVENDTAAYHRQIQRMTGLNINRRISDLSDTELARVTGAIRTVEGWTVGNTIRE